MPSGRKPKHYPDDATVDFRINLPGRVRNMIADHVMSLPNTNMNEWCGIVLRQAVEEARGLPTPPPPAAPIPRKVDILREYLTGETILEPCGQPYPCQRERNDSEFHGSIEFCGYCRIMVS